MVARYGTLQPLAYVWLCCSAFFLLLSTGGTWAMTVYQTEWDVWGEMGETRLVERTTFVRTKHPAARKRAERGRDHRPITEGSRRRQRSSTREGRPANTVPLFECQPRPPPSCFLRGQFFWLVSSGVCRLMLCAAGSATSRQRPVLRPITGGVREALNLNPVT